MITWSGYDWILKERWGEVHPDKSVCWYDPSCVEVDGSSCLHLKTKYNPKYFPELKTTAPVGIGLVSCTTKFTHGYFEIVAKMPSGPNLWPAFWMWSWDSWPPEIDVFEGYTNRNGSYWTWNPFKPWNIQTNIHYLTNNAIGRDSIGGKAHWWGYKNPTKNFIKYAVEWTPTQIRFAYDDLVVRSFTNPTILEQFNKTTMNVIINNSVDNNVSQVFPPSSDMVVKSFTYKPI